MTALKCPHCGYRSHFTHHYHWSGDEYESSLFTCDECGKPIAAMTDLEGEPIKYWPAKVWGKEFPDVPTPIARTANEAHLCLGAGSPRGAVALARAVIESLAKDKGVLKGNLESKINDLRQQDYIREHTKEVAHEIRFAGNEAAHGDLVAEPLSIEDAEEIISLMDDILGEVYQGPANVARIQAKREQRKANAKARKELTGMDLIEQELGGPVIGEPPRFSDDPPF